MTDSQQQQLSLLELLHLNFTPKPTLTEEESTVGPTTIQNDPDISPKTNQQSSSQLPTLPEPHQKPIPTTKVDNSEEIKIQKYMAIHLVDQIKNNPATFFNPFSSDLTPLQPQPNPNESTQADHHPPILASPHPHRPPTPTTDKLKPKLGLRINSSFPPQELAISIGQTNPEILYTAEPPPHVLPITLFPSSMVFAPGNRVAVDGFISYATKAGRIRVIDQNSGARMLLRKHEGPVLDMCIGRPRTVVGDLSTPSSSRRWRCIASAGSDGRLVIWKVPVRFEEDTASYEILADIFSVDSNLLLGPEKELVQSPRTLRFSAIRYHPNDPSIFLLSTNDRRLILVRLDRGAFSTSWKRGAPLSKSLSELEAFEGQDVLRTNSEVVAFAFSPDGSAFAFVTEDKILTVRQTSKPHWTIMGGQLPSSQGSITRLEFLATTAGVIKGFLITKRFGTRVEAVQLSEISEVVIGITLHPPEPADDLPCFGHSAWQPHYSTVLLSNSLRGSIFAFHLNFCDSSSSADEELTPLKPGHPEGTATRFATTASPSDDDASYIERVAATRQSTQMQRSRSNSWIASRTMFVDHISEVPSPDPIISFVLDQGMRPPPGPSSSPVSVFNLHPKGIHQLYLPKDLIDFHKDSADHPNNPSQAALPPVRSRSLAGEILVDVHVEHQVQKAEVLDFSQESPNSKKPGPSSSVAPPTVIPLLPSIEPSAIDKKPSSPSAVSKQDPSQPSKPSSNPLLDFVNHPFTSSSSSSCNVPNKSLPEPPLLLKELEKNRALVIDHVHTLLAKGLDKQEQKLRNQFLAQQEIETRRHEHLLNILSSSLSPKNLGDIVSHHVKAALVLDHNHHQHSRSKDSADAEVVKAGESVRKAVHDGLKKFLGNENEGVFKKTQLKEMVHEVVGTMSTKLEQLMAKQIVDERRQRHEESADKDKVIRELIEEVRLLRSQRNAEKTELVSLQKSLNQLVDRVSSLQDSLDLGHPSFTRVSANHLSDTELNNQSHPSEGPTQAFHSPVANPSLSSSHLRSEPTNKLDSGLDEGGKSKTDYEEVFVQALRDPSTSLLNTLIDTTPGAPHLEDTFTTIFPPHSHSNNGHQNRTCLLSQPVLLTLAHQLSQEIAASNGHQANAPGQEENQRNGLGVYGVNRLRWIWSCINAIDERDQHTAQYFDRVLGLCYHHLMSKKIQLVELQNRLVGSNRNGVDLRRVGEGKEATEEIEGVDQVLWIVQDKLQKFRNLSHPTSQ